MNSESSTVLQLDIGRVRIWKSLTIIFCQHM